MKSLEHRLNADVCLLIYSFVDTYKQAFTRVLDELKSTCHSRMIQKMWRLMYCSGKSITQGLRNLETYLLSDEFDFHSLKYNPDFYYIDRVYFQHSVMRRLMTNNPEILKYSHPLYAISTPRTPPHGLPPPPPQNHSTSRTFLLHRT